MNRTILYLSRRDVERVALSMEEIIAALEQAFIEKDQGHTEAPPKPGIHPKYESFIHAMPARVAGARAAGIKWVSGYPANPERGLPYISGLLILNDPDTGLPISVMDCTWITAKRTAAASALAARHLGRRDARVLGICGCGVQGRSHVEALSVILPELSRVLAYDIDARALERFLTDMTGAFPNLQFQPVSSAEAAVGDADVVVTAGPISKNPDPTIKKGWLAPGGFATAVDFDSYWTPEALEEMDLLITDDLDQFAYYRSLGYFSAIRAPDAELASLVGGKRPGRTSPADRTMAMFLGLAIEDMVTAAKILERARALGIGTSLDL
jgi:ornithine cyclodeaminase/alanine dehydrogenase-like protein (mu-crystallin family)